MAQRHHLIVTSASVALAAIAAALGSAGCSPLCRNEPLAAYDPNSGYRFDTFAPAPADADETFICLTFSGGGTRAAALAYGVLLGLRDTRIGPADDANGRSLLDEVDVISAVSGGSFTAMTYGVWGLEALDGRFERDFLNRNIQWELLAHLRKPQNLLRFPSVALDTIDVAATYFDEELFERRTYGDLLAGRRRPFIVVNATHMGIDRRIEFTQDDFDLLGSDLASVPVGFAVAASSAVPVVLSPLRFRYYPGPPLCDALKATLTAEDAARRNNRRHDWASFLVPDHQANEPLRCELDARNHRYLYLMDGGVVDNLGLSYVLDAYRHGTIRQRIERGSIKRLVLIMVDATNRPPSDIEQHDFSPGILTSGIKALFSGVDHNSAALTELARLLIAEQPREASADAAAAADSGRGFESFMIEVSFRSIVDRRERARFDRMNTSLALPGVDVQLLIETGKDLLRQHAEFQRLVQCLR